MGTLGGKGLRAEWSLLTSSVDFIEYLGECLQFAN